MIIYNLIIYGLINALDQVSILIATLRDSDKAAPTDFPDRKKSVEGEIASQAAAVEYFVETVRHELPATEYMLPKRQLYSYRRI